MTEDATEQATQIIERPKEERATEREYIVLSSMGGGAWEELGRVTARGHKQAVEQEVSLLTPGGDATLYVAVPVRSWKPIKARIEEQKPKVVLSEG